VPHRSRTPPRIALLSALALASVGCARDEAPRYAFLAAGHRPSFTTGRPGAPGAPGVPGPWLPSPLGGEPLTLRPGGASDGAWVDVPIAASAWKPRGGGFWSAPRAMPGEGAPAEGERQTLVVDGRSFRYVAARIGLADPGQIPPDSFCAVGNQVYVHTGSSDETPGAAVLSEYVDLGREENGSWRFKLDRLIADGIPVLPGFEEELVVDLPPESCLRFTSVARSSVDRASGHAPELTFRVFLDGAPIHGHAQAGDLEATIENHVVPLPRGGTRDARLTFRVEGPAALAAFLTPTIGPVDIGTPEERPWGDRRPDVVVFLADTFRADNLACYGGDPVLTPNLDRFAERCVRFERAWSSSTWTLPSHATMFAGLMPYQSDVTTSGDSLAPEAETIAERLNAAGYRTGAITDGAFVSQIYGLSQGFEWFDERWDGIEELLADTRRFLDADDGRPAFLFVQTYRTHVPYRVSDETVARLGEHLGLRGDFDAIWEEGERVQKELGDRAEGSPELARFRAAYHALYLGGVVDLDAGFQRFLDLMEERGILGHGYLIFTSDHGEGFWEHGIGGHGNGMYQEHLRVPLLVHGPGLAPRVVPHATTHIDFAPTIAAMAALAPAPEWVGRSLLALDADRPALSFQCQTLGDPSTLALVDGSRKVVSPVDLDLPAAERVELAFDLAADPDERADASGERWPVELLLGLDGELRDALRQRLEARAAELTAEEWERLKAIGYAVGAQAGAATGH